DRPPVVELRQPGYEGMAQFLDRCEKTQAQIGGCDTLEKLVKHWLVFRTDRPRADGCAVVQSQFPLPFLRIRPQRKARMTALMVGLDRRHAHPCIDGDDSRCI